MTRRLPPIAAIRTFESATRHLDIEAAAVELGVSPAEVSTQIRVLEGFLDTALFWREGTLLRLTLTGRNYAGKLDSLLKDSADPLHSEDHDLRVLATPGFAARFLVPRLPRFEHGGRVRLRVSESEPDIDFTRNGADVVICWSDAPVPGVVVEPLMTSGRFPVISPELRQREKVETPGDLMRLTLFHDEEMDAWSDWFEAAGLPVPELPRGPRLAHCELSSTAAEQGQGVALAFELMMRQTLEDGALERLFDSITIPVTIYSLAYPETRAGDPLIRSFRDWIATEVAREQALTSDQATGRTQ